MKQNFSLNPFLDGLLIRHQAKVIPQFAKTVDRGAFVVGLVRAIIKDDLAAELVNPKLGDKGHRVLMLRVNGDIIEDFVFHTFYKSQ